MKIRARPANLGMNEHNENRKEAIGATTQEAVQINAIVPTLTVDDLQKSITFYEALGFAIEERWEEKGTLLGVMLRAGSAQIGLNQDDWKKGRDRKKGIGVRLSISTTPGNVDEIANRPGMLASRSSRTRTIRSGRAARSKSAIRVVPADGLFRRHRREAPIHGLEADFLGCLERHVRCRQVRGRPEKPCLFLAL